MASSRDAANLSEGSVAKTADEIIDQQGKRIDTSCAQAIWQGAQDPAAIVADLRHEAGKQMALVYIDQKGVEETIASCQQVPVIPTFVAVFEHEVVLRMLDKLKPQGATGALLEGLFGPNWYPVYVFSGYSVCGFKRPKPIVVPHPQRQLVQAKRKWWQFWK